MFSTPNIKAMEVVVHFLFTKLNHDSAKAVYRYVFFILSIYELRKIKNESIMSLVNKEMYVQQI